ncbi:MAG: DUF1616 domain-containing protein [Chloroflexi bacterium]|nr:DUF1616 domain-containing protein [Chloroflexota bacterium]
MVTGQRLKLRYELWALLAGGGLLLTLIALDVDLGVPVLGILRLALGLAFILFVPGYLLQASIFRRIGQIDGYERSALSLVLSIAFIPPVALLLDLLPFAAVDLVSIVISEAILVLVLWPFSFYRRMRVLREHRFAIMIPGRRHDNAGTEPSAPGSRRTNLVLAAVFALVVATIGAIVLFPAPAQEYTEFYVLSERGLTEGIPRSVPANTPLRMIVGIVSAEGEANQYSVEVISGEDVLATVDAIRLAPSERFETTIEFVLTDRGPDREVLLLLYLDPTRELYRRLRLIFDVT